MGRRSSVLTLVIINVIVTLVVVFAVISIINSQNDKQPGSQIVITVPILITATTDPNLTETIRIVTATPLPGTPGVVSLPTGLLDGLNGTVVTAPTIDPAIFGADNSLQETATALPANCILYTIKEGDTPFGIATDYGIDGNDLMAVNGLDEESAALLQIGEVLIVPLAGCSLPTAVVREVATEEATIATHRNQRAKPDDDGRSAYIDAQTDGFEYADCDAATYSNQRAGRNCARAQPWRHQR